MLHMKDGGYGSGMGGAGLTPLRVLCVCAGRLACLPACQTDTEGSPSAVAVRSTRFVVRVLKVARVRGAHVERIQKRFGERGIRPHIRTNLQPWPRDHGTSRRSMNTERERRRASVALAL
jgi:hypothetical protein